MALLSTPQSARSGVTIGVAVKAWPGTFSETAHVCLHIAPPLSTAVNIVSNGKVTIKVLTVALRYPQCLNQQSHTGTNNPRDARVTSPETACASSNRRPLTRPHEEPVGQPSAVSEAWLVRRSHTTLQTSTAAPKGRDDIIRYLPA